MRALLPALILLGVAACAPASCNRAPDVPFERTFAFDAAQQSARAIDLTPDGRRILFASPTGHVRSYAEPWKAPAEINIGNTLVGAGPLRGGRVFVAARDRIEVWDGALSQRERELTVPAGEPDLSRSQIALSPDARYLAVDDAVYDSEQARWVLPPFGHGHQTAQVFAGDSQLLTAGQHDRTVALRALASAGKATWQAPAPITAAAITHDAKLVLVATTDGVASWAPPAAAPSNEVALAGATHVVLCQGDALAAVLAGRAVHLLELPGLRERARLPLQATGTALACDGGLLAAGDEQGRVYAWDVARGDLVGNEAAFDAPVSAIAVAASPRRILAVANGEQAARGLLLQVAAR